MRGSEVVSKRLFYLQIQKVLYKLSIPSPSLLEGSALAMVLGVAQGRRVSSSHLYLDLHTKQTIA